MFETEPLTMAKINAIFVIIYSSIWFLFGGHMFFAACAFWSYCAMEFWMWKHAQQK